MKHVLIRELMNLTERNRDGSFSTQAARRDILAQVGRQLLQMGYRNLGAQGLKPKHVQSLLDHWRGEGLSVATMKNRMAHLRWWAEKVGKQNVIPRTNDELELGRRKYVTNQTKARDLPDVALSKIKDERLRISLELQKAFGLRREECLKFQPFYQAAEILPTITPQLTRCPDNRGTPPTRQTSQTCAEQIPTPRAYSPCATSMISFPPITPCA